MSFNENANPLRLNPGKEAKLVRHARFSGYIGMFLIVAGLSVARYAFAVDTSPMAIVPPSSGVFGPADVPFVLERIYISAEKQARHLLTKVRPWRGDPAFRLLTESKSDEHWIRPNTGALLGFAFLAQFGSYDLSMTGVSREKLIAESIIPMTRYLTATHLTGNRDTDDGKRWGSQWQSAHWAHMLGRAAWWVWDELPADLRESVRKLIAHEADRIAKTAPPSAIKGDTKSEENAWNSQILSVAVVLMPEHPDRKTWETAFQRWALSSFLRPADANSRALVDGRPVCEQFTGANIYDDFTLENHGRVHPDYMGAFILSMGCLLDYMMTGRTAPEAARYNCAGIYENLKWFSLPSGGLIYPNGQDWELLRDPEWLYLHVLMAAHGGDPDAWSLAKPSLTTQELMQARSTSGTVYWDDEFFFPSMLSDQIYYSAMAWLALKYRNSILDRPVKRRGVLRLDQAAIILNRTPMAIHTLSWGAQVMAQFVVNRTDRLTSPHPRSGIGEIHLVGEGKPLPVHLVEVKVRNTPRSFWGELVLDHGGGDVRARIRWESQKDGSVRFRETLNALRDLETADIRTGLIGVLNNPHWVYERGRREIAVDGEAHIVQSGQGTRVESQDVKCVAVDGILKIHGKTPLSILYAGATEPDRARYTDELYLNHLGGSRQWRAGQTISTLDAIIQVQPSETLSWSQKRPETP